MRALGRILAGVALTALTLVAAAILFDWLRYAGLAIATAAAAATLARKLPARVLVAAALAIPAAVLLGGWWPRLFAPYGLDDAVIEDLPLGVSATGRPLRPFLFSWNPATRHLLVTHAHGDDGGSGVTLVDLSEITPRTDYFPGPEEHAHSATELAAQATVAVHVSSEAVPRTFLYPLAGDAPPIERFETRFAELEASVLDARVDTLFLSDLRRQMLGAISPASFVTGDFSALAEWRAPFQNVKQLVLDPERGGVVVGRSDLPGRVLRLDAASGAITTRSLGLYCPAIAIEGRRHELYATQTYRNSIAVLDASTLRVLRRRVIGGWPYDAEPITTRGWIAVGSFIGNRVLFLDAETLALRASLGACAKVRSLFFDERDAFLYFGDACGLHRVRLAPPRS
ncbi:MAG: hypothetical protein IPK07_12415 [Deltaproteobacteria bacterium]|jgi:hypothetical protein|nr:hypothetical protein [Deltaproteobacteria bacterium]